MYAEVAAKPWAQVLAENSVDWTPPITVHLPIQPLHSPDFVRVDRALNVMRTPVLAGQSVHDLRPARAVEDLVVQFALDDPPAVPDWHYSTLTLAEGRYPVVHGEYYVHEDDLRYTFDYACPPVEGTTQALLWVQVTVQNVGIAPKTAHVWPKIGLYREEDILDYHYIPWYWDASKWRPGDRVALQGTELRLDGQPFGKVVPGDFTCAWVTRQPVEQAGYRWSWTKSFVHPSQRLAEVRDALHCQAELAPGESKSFALALLTHYEDVKPAHLQALHDATAASCRAEALAHFQAALTPAQATLTFPTAHWGDIVTALQLNTLGLLVEFPGDPTLLPTQGGSSERHYVWVWEVANTLLPMLQLGHFAPVRRALDFVFQLQDGGCPPEGRLTSTAGAVGTTGPRWLNSTGSALALAADYYRYAHDEAFLTAYLPKLLRAADWIVGELRATRTLNADGSRPAWYGLMPFGCGTDGDIGYTVAFTDAYTWRGLDKTVRLLEGLHHPRAAEFAKEAAEYRNDIGLAVATMTRADGYIDRKILTGDADEVVFTKAEDTCGAMQLGYCGAVDMDTPAFSRYIAYMEQHRFDGPFLGPMDREVAYMGVGEWTWQDIYLRRGEWKKAFLAVQTNLHYGMTPDTFQTQERFSRANPAFTPWQPNASGNGRMLEMLVKSLYCEHDGAALVFGGVPFAWLRANGTTRLDGLYTPAGRVSLDAVMQSDGRCRVTLTGAVPPTVRFPEFFTVERVGEGVYRLGEQPGT